MYYVLYQNLISHIIQEWGLVSYDDTKMFMRITNLGRIDQLKHAAQAYRDRHFSPPVNFLFQESLLYTSIYLRRNVSIGIDNDNYNDKYFIESN